MTELFLKISGQVHGVGFRYETKQVAGQLNLFGWVRNAPDGTVEILAQGEKTNLEQLETWVRRSAPGSIDQIITKWRQIETHYQSFGIES